MFYGEAQYWKSIIFRQKQTCNFPNKLFFRAAVVLSSVDRVYVAPQAVYQNIVQLSYVDKLLDQVSLAFRDQYKNELAIGAFRKVNFGDYFQVSGVNVFVTVDIIVLCFNLYQKILKAFEEESKKMAQLPKQMRPYQARPDSKEVAPVSSPPPAVEASNPDGREGAADSVTDSPKNSLLLSKLGSRWDKGKASKPGKKCVMLVACIPSKVQCSLETH